MKTLREMMDLVEAAQTVDLTEDVSGLTDAEYNTVARYAKSKYPAMVMAALGRNPDGSINVRMHDTKGLGITKEFKVRFRDPEETDIKEARRLKGADLQLKLVDREEDDDTDLDDVVTDYYFDVYQNGQKVGHAQGDSYHGELVVKVDFNREFKLDTYHDKDHPLIQQFEKFQQQGVAEMDTYPHPKSKEGKRLTKAIRDPNAPEVKPQPVKKTVKDATKILDKEFQKSVKEDQIEETSEDPVAKIDALFRDK